MKHNKYSIYYDHIDYTMIEWELPADIEVDPERGLENYEAIEWGIKHGIFDLLPIIGYRADGTPLDAWSEEFDERCIEASTFTDDPEFADYMIPFYEFNIMEAGKSPYVRKLEELIDNKPAIRREQ